MYCSACVVYWDDSDGDICWNCGGNDNTPAKSPFLNNGSQSPVYTAEFYPSAAPPPMVQAQNYAEMCYPDPHDMLEYYA